MTDRYIQRCTYEKRDTPEDDWTAVRNKQQNRYVEFSADTLNHSRFFQIKHMPGY